ncbi:MAG: Holliday junction resolvase RuvX [Anaerolineae bacterium]
MPTLLALDIGEKRTGVAVGSTESGVVRAHSVLKLAARQAFVDRVRQLIAETGAKTVVVGCPMQPDGTVSPQGERIRRFVEGFAAEIGVPVVFWNEAYSSIDAQALLFNSGKGRRRRSQQVDAVAAAVFLQDYLDHLRREARRAPAEPPAEGE